MKQNKIELLAPAGNLEKLKMAIIYGADAVYLGGEEFGLRASADNFTDEEMIEGVEFAHTRNKKVYLTMNIIPHNEDFEKMPEFIRFAEKISVDAIIISDPGIYSMVKQLAPNLNIHLSTQANNTNWMSAKFWYELGVKRIVLARELSLDEIKEIREKVPKDLQLEIFAHGSMCISYSGRCLLSNYMTGRDSNKGLCAHPCRWQYHLVEEKRPGEYFPVYENERGTFIYNSSDLCMIEYIPEIIASGVTSLKIEGRMKSAYYVATVVKTYRDAIDAYYKNPLEYKYEDNWLDELSKSSHREFTTGFYLGKTSSDNQIYNTSSYIREYDFVGMVTDYDKETRTATIEQRNRMFKGEEIEILRPFGKYFTQKIGEMQNADREVIKVAQHPQMTVYMAMDQEVVPYTIIRRKSKNNNSEDK